MTEVIEKTEYKKGYKKTRLGWIPEKWEVKKLGDFGNFKNGISKGGENFGFGTPIIGLNDVFGKFYIKENNLNSLVNASEQELIDFNLNKGDVLFVRSSVKPEGVGLPCVVESNLEKTTFSGFLIRFRDTKGILNDKYKRYCFLLEYFRHRLLSKSTISANTNINQPSLASLNMIVPSLKEQEKIAEILSVWDDGIETLEKLIEQKEILKKATMQKLFFEKESWQMMRFDKIFKDFCKKNCPRERLLSATQENGVIPRDMLSGKVMSPEGSLNGYKLIEAGDFVISLRSFQGGLEYSKYRGILSPAYTVLKNIIDIDKDFYRHFFKSYKFIEKYLSISVIGIRDGKQISYSDLSSVKIPYPPLEEQEKIGKILNCYDEELQLLNSKLEKLKEQKKGLMQKLLTGQIRVKL